MFREGNQDQDDQKSKLRQVDYFLNTDLKYGKEG